MSEQAVTKLEVVPAAKFDSAIGEQAVGRVSFVDEAGTPVEIGGGAVPENRLVPDGGTSGQVLKRGASGPEWGADVDTNTTYPDLTAAQVQAGTATTPSTITAKVLADEIDRRVAAAIAAIPG